MVLEPAEAFARAGKVAGIHAQVRVDIRTDEPRPDGSLVIRRIARPEIAVVLRLVIAVTRRK